MKEIKNINSYTGYEVIRIENAEKIKEIIYSFDKMFKPTLSERISDLDSYAKKLHKNAFVLAIMQKNEYIGFIAFYANDKNMNIAYLSQIAVQTKAQNQKLGELLINLCIDISRNNGMSKLKLEIYNCNTTAIYFYKKNGFEFCGKASEESMYMIKKLK